MRDQLISKSITDNKPEYFYGYTVVIASAVIMAVTYGINYTFGIFFKPLMDEFGWTRALISGAYAVSTLIAGFWGIFAGRISDRLGPKTVGIFGGFCLGIGFILMSMVREIWHFYLVYGLIIALGVGGCWPILMATVAKWFIAKRGMMTGILAAGVGIGTLVTPPLATWLISIYSWRAAYAIVGTGTLILITAASLFLKRDPHKIGQLPYGINQERPSAEVRKYSFRDVVMARQFWMVSGVYFCFGYCLHSVMVHIVLHATGQGISPARAAVILAIIGGTTIVIKVLSGISSDRFGIKPTVILGLIILTADLVWLQAAGQLWAFYVFGIAFGCAYGNIMTMQSLLLAQLFGLGSLGVIVGGVTFLYTVGAAIGPLMAGRIYDTTGSYSLAFAVCAMLAAIAIILIVLVKPVADQK